MNLIHFSYKYLKNRKEMKNNLELIMNHETKLCLLCDKHTINKGKDYANI